ncbi:MAG TPA: hypothetical protein VFM82_12150 [Flavobacteriaceae bacterium]|nr:hypothetical protein [Flavobacteriaceae bacterium]
MKEVQSIEKDKITITKQVKQEKQKHIARIKPHKGHTLFEVNLANGEIRKAKFEPLTAGWTREKQSKKVMVQKDCIYVPALNVKNVIKKLLRK